MVARGNLLYLVCTLWNYQDVRQLALHRVFTATLTDTPSSKHVVERWTLIDANTIAYEATLEDPTVFSRPWSIKVYLYRHREPHFELIENYCYTLDYDPYYPVLKP